MAVIETKFSVGDKVWHASTVEEQRQHPCPDCNGERKWQAVSPAGYEYTFACPRCSARFASHDELSLAYTAHAAAARQLTIGSVRHDSHEGAFGNHERNTYMCQETGVGGGTIYYESNLFSTEAEALVAAELMAAKNNSTLKHIVDRYNRSLEISDYQLESGLLKQANEAAAKARGLLWNLNELFSSIEEADDKEAINETVEDYKRYQWQRDKDAIAKAEGRP